jgi:hypothetical protein
MREAAMGENKTKPTGASVEQYIASRANAQQQADCAELIELLGRLTGEEARMWGPSIVGFGSYRYVYESGREGEAALVGFAIRGRELVLYVNAEGEHDALRAQLGKHKMGKSCLYFKQLADLDKAILEKILAASIAAIRRRYQ